MFGSLNGSEEGVERRVERVDARVVEVGGVEAVARDRQARRRQPPCRSCRRRPRRSPRSRSATTPGSGPLAVSKRNREAPLDAVLADRQNRSCSACSTVPVGPPGTPHGCALRTYAAVERRVVRIRRSRPTTATSRWSERPQPLTRARIGKRSAHLTSCRRRAETRRTATRVALAPAPPTPSASVTASRAAPAAARRENRATRDISSTSEKIASGTSGNTQPRRDRIRPLPLACR